MSKKGGGTLQSRVVFDGAAETSLGPVRSPGMTPLKLP
jgi:hypothetical protein